MSRSKKKPYYKDKGYSTKEYWGPIRRHWNQHLHVHKLDEDLAFKNPKEIINDYDYCDYWFYVEADTSCNWSWGFTEEDVKRYSRK